MWTDLERADIAELSNPVGRGSWRAVVPCAGKESALPGQVTPAMLTETNREQYLIGHIPYRLQSLRLCHSVCEQHMTPHRDYGTELWIGECLVLDEGNRLLVNPIIESGLIYSRVLLEFLGVGRDRKTGLLKQIKRSKEPGNISITDFGLPMVTTTQAVSGFSYVTPSEADAALRHVIETANKTVAHLTAGPVSPGTFPSLRICCRVAIDLVCRHLYAPLGELPLVSPIEETKPIPKQPTRLR